MEKTLKQTYLLPNSAFMRSLFFLFITSFWRTIRHAMSQSIARNTAFMTSASILQKVISFAYFTLIARSIGPANTGKYFFALSFTTIFVVFVDLGLTNVFIREAAKAKDKIQSYFSTLLGVKIIFGFFAYLAMFVAIHFFGASDEVRSLVYLSGFTMLFDSMHLTMYGVLRALGDLRYEAISIPTSQLIAMALGSIFIFFDFPLIYLMLAFTVPSVLNVCFVASVLIFRHGIFPIPQFNKNYLFDLALIGWPFTLAAIFARIYSFADSIILSKLAGDTVVGWYSIAYKITFAFQFVPLALTAALYPKLSQYFATDKTKLSEDFERSVHYLLIVAMPIAIGISTLARPIVLAIYNSEYLPAVLPLQILIISLIFSFISFPIGAMLNACNRQKTQTTIVGLTLLGNLGLNVLLIPILGAVGAAISALIGNVMLSIAGYMMIPKDIGLNHGQIIKTVLRISSAALAMGAITFFLGSYIHFIFTIIISAICYVVFLLLTGALHTDEIRKLLFMVKNRL